MENLIIIPTTFAHLVDLSHTLRDADLAEIDAGGNKPLQSLKFGFRRSIFCRTALVDGKPAAIWGLMGPLIGRTGTPWLLTGIEADKIGAVRFARIYAGQVLEMLRYFSHLEAFCHARYANSLRLLRMCGFTVDEPIAHKSGEMFCRFWIKE